MHTVNIFTKQYIIYIKWVNYKPPKLYLHKAIDFKAIQIIWGIPLKLEVKRKRLDFEIRHGKVILSEWCLLFN